MTDLMRGCIKEDSVVKKNEDFQDIQSGTSDSILASLYRRILKVHAVEMRSFDKMLVEYVNKVHGAAASIKDRTSIRSNLYKELLKDKITFKVFIKGLRVLGIKKFDIMVRLYLPNGQTTLHEKSVILDEDHHEQPSSTNQE